VHIVCRDTRAAAEAYYDHYATEFGDHGAVDTYIAENSRSGKPALAAAMKLQRKRIAGGFGSYGIVGSSGDVAEQILQLRDAGFCGISVSFVDFVSELPHFLETVMPRLEAAGIR
jgi:alkanesulfonate monooxygenase SsuD/methylene tetrahydromethanopterin reductase-like flavin-dependent oxidoreductase (luciferase family)